MAGFCSRCGHALNNDGACLNPSCPTKAQARRTPSQGDGLNSADMKEIGAASASALKKFFIAEGGGIKLGAIIQVLAALLALFYFLPLFSVSCQGMKITFNGFSATFGKVISMGSFMGERLGSERIPGNFLAIFILVIPVVLFLLFLAKDKVALLRRSAMPISTVLSILGIIVFIVLAAVVKEEAAKNSMTASFKGAYTFSIIFYVLILLLSILGCWQQRKRQ